MLFAVLKCLTFLCVCWVFMDVLIVWGEGVRGHHMMMIFLAFDTMALPSHPIRTRYR